MTRLQRAFDKLTSRKARGADEVFAASRDQASRSATRRRNGIALAAAAAVVLVAGSAVALRDPGPQVVETGPGERGGDTDLTSSSTSSTTSAPVAPAAEISVQVHFSSSADIDCSATEPVGRDVAAPAVLRGALEELLRGPDAAELADGLVSWFSEDTEGMLRSVEVIDGVAHVDFDNFATAGSMNGASTSCGSANLMSQLERTATQFETVDSAVYYFEGDAAAFYGWLQGEPPAAALGPGQIGPPDQ